MLDIRHRRWTSSSDRSSITSYRCALSDLSTISVIANVTCSRDIIVVVRNQCIYPICRCLTMLPSTATAVTTISWRRWYCSVFLLWRLHLNYDTALINVSTASTCNYRIDILSSWNICINHICITATTASSSSSRIASCIQLASRITHSPPFWIFFYSFCLFVRSRSVEIFYDYWFVWLFCLF